ncbi:MAG TPA: amidohydrolase family protein [Thermoleophilaceae bacterium]|jgi:predicted TIM-barrel fold metal-dependent hydrolase
MTRVDAHAHVISQAYIDAIPAPGGNLPKPPVVSAEALLGMMDRYAIDAAVISTGPPGAFFGDQAQANEIARLANEEISAAVTANRARFAGLAMLPLPDSQAALAELAHALDTMGLEGVLLLSQVAGTYLGDPAWEPLYAELDARGAYVFLHPTVPANGVVLPHPGWLYEFPFDTTRALANLIYSGTFERYPNIRWQVSHLGGATTVLAHRIASLAAREPDKADAAPAGALEYLSRLYYDTGLANHELPYRAAAMLAPASHFVFGTDWPYLVLPNEPDDPAPDLGFLGDAERASLDSANIGALVPRFGA